MVSSRRISRLTLCLCFLFQVIGENNAFKQTPSATHLSPPVYSHRTQAVLEPENTTPSIVNAGALWGYARPFLSAILHRTILLSPNQLTALATGTALFSSLLFLSIVFSVSTLRHLDISPHVLRFILTLIFTYGLKVGIGLLLWLVSAIVTFCVHPSVVKFGQAKIHRSGNKGEFHFPKLKKGLSWEEIIEIYRNSLNDLGGNIDAIREAGVTHIYFTGWLWNGIRKSYVEKAGFSFNEGSYLYRFFLFLFRTLLGLAAFSSNVVLSDSRWKILRNWKRTARPVESIWILVEDLPRFLDALPPPHARSA